MNLIVLYHSGRANGVLTSIIDLYNNVSKYKDVELKIATDDIGKFILLCKRNHYFGCEDILSCITNETHFEADTIITSTKTFNDPITMKYNKLILLDSLDVVKAHYGLIPIPERETENITLLCNPANIDLLYFDSKEYYHKFSPERLQTITVACEQLLYMRNNKESAYIIDGVYFENIGKVIFEALYLGKGVGYYGDEIHDGLYYYLKLFRIDGERDYIPLIITPSEIENTLFMKDDDLILELI